MNINDAHPSKYLKAADLTNGDVVLTMKSGVDPVVMAVIGEPNSGPKPVLSFDGTDKQFVLNITNGNTITQQHGAETAAWSGKKITIFPTQTDYQGQAVACIRVRIAAPLAPGQIPTQSAVDPVTNEPVNDPGLIDDGSIPF